MIDLDTIATHVSWVAQKIREGKPPADISITLVHWTQEAWRHDHLRGGADEIKRAFPQDFR